jgi:hypothetical protein
MSKQQTLVRASRRLKVARPESQVRIGGTIYLYRQKAPFVPSGVSIHGALEYDASNDLIRCHECGLWFRSLCGHLGKIHSLQAVEYKVRHGLNLQSSLVCEGLRVANAERMAASTTVGFQGWTQDQKRAHLAHHLARPRKPKRFKRANFETNNAKQMCHAQLLERLRHLAATLGHTPTHSELITAGLAPSSLLHAFNVHSIASVMSLAGLEPNPIQRYYTAKELIEILRDFYVENERLPVPSDHRRGLLPCYMTFVRHFGSSRAAYVAAGLSVPASRGGRRGPSVVRPRSASAAD